MIDVQSRHPPRHSFADGLGWLFRMMALPIRGLLSIRRSMTGASVSLLLMAIISLNIIWGYPWSGIFSACVALLVAGFAINRLMRPQLQVDFSLPTSSPAGQPFAVVTHLHNRGRFPAMEMGIKFADKIKKRSWKGRRHSPQKSIVPVTGDTRTHSISMIRSMERMRLKDSLTYTRRGIHRLPNLEVVSMFPFHLFRYSSSITTTATVAITPRILSAADEDAVARSQVSAIGNFSRKLLFGDTLNYTGSREYEMGMPVRRWDFTSWARLGKPVVREYQSPSIHEVAVIVDTSRQATPEWDGDLTSQDVLIEQVLSIAATAISELNRSVIHVQMHVTGEATDGLESGPPGTGGTDCEPLLIRLASANRTTEREANQGIQEVFDLIGKTPALILTAREHIPTPRGMPPHAVVIHAAETNDQRSDEQRSWTTVAK